MALEPSLWGTLPEEVLHLVFARLPVIKIGQLQVLSKDWKWNIDCKHSEFNRVFNAAIHFNMFILMSRSSRRKTYGRIYDMQAEKWHVFEYNTDLHMIQIEYAPDGGKDGGLFCSTWQWRYNHFHFPIVVVNPLIQRKMELPPLLHMGSGKSNVQVKIVQLTMDRKRKEYKVHVVAYMKYGGNGLFVQVYDSHLNAWSVMESREGRIIGWNQEEAYLTNFSSSSWWPCVYNCADGNLHHFNPSDIAAGFKENDERCRQLVNDHFFVLHKKDGESTSGKYCISEFHLPEKATSWVKLGVHNCDPNICHSPGKLKFFSLLACNGFLIVQCWEYIKQDYDRRWLYNLSTCAWRNLPDKLKLNYNEKLVMCEMSWSARP